MEIMFIHQWYSWLSSRVRIVDGDMRRGKNVTPSSCVIIMKVKDKVIGDREVTKRGHLRMKMK